MIHDGSQRYFHPTLSLRIHRKNNIVRFSVENDIRCVPAEAAADSISLWSDTSHCRLRRSGRFGDGQLANERD